jgi:hypothetical protein
MAAPKPGEPLLLYIVATTDAMSMVQVAERQDTKAEEAPKSQPLEAHPASKLGDGPNTVTKCHPRMLIWVRTTKRSLGSSNWEPPWTLGARSPWSLNPQR